MTHLPTDQRTFLKRESEIFNAPAVDPGQFYSILGPGEKVE